ncbi:MAG: hypothetical protein GY817_00775 [bacterium]|nr:hypothetical protein [bacterium]
MGRDIKRVVESGGEAPSSTNLFKIENGVIKQVSGSFTEDFVFGSPQMDDDTDTAHDNRFFLKKSKGAFRAGKTLYTEWNDENIGLYSIGLGLGAVARGDYAVSLGVYNEANGLSAIAAGYSVKADGAKAFACGGNTEANASSSFAGGNYSEANGTRSAVFGDRANAQAYASFVCGRFNLLEGSSGSWVDTDPLFVIGNGGSSSTRSNAMTVLKDGTVKVGTKLKLFSWGNAVFANTLEFESTTVAEIRTADGVMLGLNSSNNGKVNIANGGGNIGIAGNASDTSSVNIQRLSTAATGLVAGDVWNDNGILKIA